MRDLLRIVAKKSVLFCNNFLGIDCQWFMIWVVAVYSWHISLVIGIHEPYFVADCYNTVTNNPAICRPELVISELVSFYLSLWLLRNSGFWVMSIYVSRDAETSSAWQKCVGCSFSWCFIIANIRYFIRWIIYCGLLFSLFVIV